MTDEPSAGAPASGESFHTVVAPRYGHVVRGVAFVPGSDQGGHGWSSGRIGMR